MLTTIVAVGVGKVYFDFLVELEVGHLGHGVNQHREGFGQGHVVREGGEWADLFQAGGEILGFALFITVHFLQPYSKWAHF